MFYEKCAPLGGPVWGFKTVLREARKVSFLMFLRLFQVIPGYSQGGGYPGPGPRTDHGHHDAAMYTMMRPCTPGGVPTHQEGYLHTGRYLHTRRVLPGYIPQGVLPGYTPPSQVHLVHTPVRPQHAARTPHSSAGREEAWAQRRRESLGERRGKS